MQITTSICHSVRNAKDRAKRWPVVIQVTYQRDPRKYGIKEDPITAAEFQRLYTDDADGNLVRIRRKAEKELARALALIDSLPDFSFPEFSRLFLRKKADRSKPAKPPKYTLQASLHDDLQNICAPVQEPEKPEILHEVSASEGVKYATKYGIANVFFQEFEEPFKTKFKNQYGCRKYPKIKSRIDFAAWGEVAKVYGIEIQKCEKEKRSEINLFNSLISILNFKKDLSFKDVTVEFLNDYKQWMEDRGRTVSTIGFYLRPLRTVFNTAIDNGRTEEKIYPFGRRRFIIPESNNEKKAVSTESLSKLYYSRPTCWQEEMYKDFWFFIYFGNGMNVKDIALLKFHKIKGDFIEFNRAKTIKTTQGNSKKIRVYINPDLRRILDRWMNKDASPDNYIFPILEPELKPYEIRERVQLFIKRINHWMKIIAEREGVEEKVLTMSGRHSCASQLRNANVNKEFIREVLGHVDPKSIDNYFADFPKEQHKKYIANLEAFKTYNKTATLAEGDEQELIQHIIRLLTRKIDNHAA